MSVSSNSRKESTESNAAQQMHSTMGIHPDLAQLNDKSLENDLPSRVAGSSDTDVPGDVAQADATAEDGEADRPGMSQADINEAKRASWGQSPLPADADVASTDEDSPMTAYQQPSSSMDNETVPDADWNRSTTDGAIPATRTNEPDRTLGNS